MPFSARPISKPLPAATAAAEDFNAPADAKDEIEAGLVMEAPVVGNIIHHNANAAAHAVRASMVAQIQMPDSPELAVDGVLSSEDD